MEYNIHKISYKSSYNRKILYAKLYIPLKKIKGCVQIIHGLNEHINRYQEIMQFFAKSGYVCFGSDLLGHGKSVINKSDLGFFAQDKGYKYVISDTIKIFNIIKKKYPGKPMFMFGHDIGSFIAKLCASKYKNEINGIILSGTCSRKSYMPFAIEGFEHLIKKRGTHYRSNIFDKAIYNFYNHKYPYTIHKKDFISRERAIINSFLSDPYCNFTYTASGIKDIFTLAYCSTNPSWVKSINKNLAILILTGDMDPTGRFGKDGKQLYKELVKNNICDVTLNVYPDSRHNVLMDINRYEVYLDLINWLNDTLDIWNYE